MAKKKTKSRSSKKKKKSSKGKSSSGGGGGSGGGLMALRGGFKGAVGSMTGKAPKTKSGALISNIVWTVLTVIVLALLAYKIYGWLQ